MRHDSLKIIGILVIVACIVFLVKKGSFSSIRGELLAPDTTVYERVRTMVDINPADFTLTKREMKTAMVTAITKVIIGTDLTYDFSGNGAISKNDLRLFLSAIQYLLTCGNGQITSPETCDDGNTRNEDGCSAICTTETGFTCTGTPSVCQGIPSTQCGNGTVEAGEQCDDGNTVSGDGCSGTEANIPNGACQHEFCGDGYKDADGHPGDPSTIEQCDDGGVCQGGPNDGNPCTGFLDDPACGAQGTCMKINSPICSASCTLLSL